MLVPGAYAGFAVGTRLQLCRFQCTRKLFFEGPRDVRFGSEAEILTAGTCGPLYPR
jgi:hypothetical protein